MTRTVYNATGAVVVAQCTRCGARISNVYEYQGKPYGSECIEIVTGVKMRDWVVRGGRIDEEATAERNRQRDEQRRLLAEQAAQREAQAAVNRAANEWLLQVLRPLQFDFAQGMVQHLERCALEDLSDRALNCLCDVYAKEFGRRGSKVYQAAENEFWGHIEEQPA